MYYSQAGEDKFLNNTYFKNKKNGTYIELGALDGVLYSNTKYFEDNLNWKGILIEPHPYNYELLVKNRPNNFLFNNLVSNKKEETSFRFFIANKEGVDYSGVSGIEETLPEEHFKGFFSVINDKQMTIQLKPKTLTEIVKSTNIKNIDFLSLDVEGHEYEVLMSWDFSIPIELILIETLGGSMCEKENLCRQILINNGYKLEQKYMYNEIYVLDR